MGYLTQRMAWAIVGRIARVTPYSVNVTDIDGKVFAGTDEKMVGRVRPAAARVYEQQEACIVYVSVGEETKGICFPLRFNEHIEAVLEIGGDVDEIMHIGQLIVALAEILMENNAMQEVEATKESRRNDFFFEWVHTPRAEYDERFRENAGVFGIDLDLVRRAVVVKMRRVRYSVLEDVRSMLLEGEYVVRQSVDGFTVLLRDGRDLRERVSRMLNLTSDFSLCAVGFSSDSAKETVDSAERTLQTGMLYHPEERLFFDEDMVAELLMASLDGDRHLQQLCGCFRENDEDGSLCRTVLAYGANGEDQKKVCEALFIHRNTLSYRLTRLRELTGLDPRNPRQFTLLYAAALQRLKEMKEV